MKVDAPLRVQLPAAGTDNPSWVRVGVIAAVGFVVGVGWPRLVGARLGPSLPADSAAAARREASPDAPASSAPRVASAGAPSGAGAPPASSAPAAATPVSAAMPALTVNHGVLLSCRSDDGQTLKGVTACGGLAGFDAIAQPRLRKLSTCPAASAATSGKLSVVFNLDFASHHLGADVGKSSTVSDPQGFAACVKGAFQGVSLGALDHQNPKYTIGYNLVFSPTDHVAPASSTVIPSGPADGVPVAAVTPSASPSSSSKPEDDTNVEVAWDVAIVRDAPRTGAVVARLPRGTKIRLGASQEGWFKIGYGTGSEGWVYRGAVGR